MEALWSEMCCMILGRKYPKKNPRTRSTEDINYEEPNSTRVAKPPETNTGFY